MMAEQTRFEGETLTSKDYQQEVVQHLPIYLAALRPKMIESAAEVGEGVSLARSALPKIMQHVAIGAERAGKDPDALEVVCRHAGLSPMTKQLREMLFDQRCLRTMPRRFTSNIWPGQDMRMSRAKSANDGRQRTAHDHRGAMR
eukprot:Selendium_serpulae@DN6520_c5_g5_i4.p1